MSGLSTRSQAIVNEISAMTQDDAPTHGGRVLSYVYDTGIEEIDALAAAAAREVQAINGLDPTTFPSVARMERDLLGFVRELLNGDESVFGNVTSGGTESCLLAIKTARDLWRANHPEAGAHAVGKIVAPATVHAATHKAAAYFDLELDLVPVDPDTGAVDPAAVIARLDDRVAVVVLSAPNYPYAQVDPVAEIAPKAAEQGISVHVDACIGGLALPWWQGALEPWDFRVPGVTSISADLHKFGYAPKGISVLLQRDVVRHRAQYFSVIGWPGYPVVNPTLLGSKSAGPIAAAWAIMRFLGDAGYRDLTVRTQNATKALVQGVNAVQGLKVVGTPTGPLFAAVADSAEPPAKQVDPHLLVDELRKYGWIAQAQPGCVQQDGTELPRSAHFTITPVVDSHVKELLSAIREAARNVRGLGRVDQALAVTQTVSQMSQSLAELGVAEDGSGINNVAQAHITHMLSGLGVDATSGGLPTNMAPLLAVAQQLPAVVAQRMLTELLALVVTPTRPNVEAHNQLKGFTNRNGRSQHCPSELGLDT